MPDPGGTLEDNLRARFADEELAREPTARERRCEGADAYDGKEPPTCFPLCIACVEKCSRDRPDAGRRVGGEMELCSGYNVPIFLTDSRNGPMGARAIGIEDGVSAEWKDFMEFGVGCFARPISLPFKAFIIEADAKDIAGRSMVFHTHMLF